MDRPPPAAVTNQKERALDEGLHAKLNELSEKIADVSFTVTNVIEAEDPTLQEVDSCHDAVAEVAAFYADLVGSVPEKDRLSLERSHGRRVTDLRRLASKLPQKSTGRAARPAAGGAFGWIDGFRREDPVADTRPAPEPAPEPAPRRAPKPAVSVGGWVQAWCGPCGGLKEHTVVAMVGGEAKQVLCEACGARHGFRTTPARSKGEASEVTATAAASGRMTKGQVEAQRREDAKAALAQELAAAEEVRSFDRRGRYKVGEIIEHPQHGRGKIENVLKGSLLVRFRDGLKSVSTY